MFLHRFFKETILPMVHLFYPHYCAVCGERLHEGEKALCLRCNMDLPRTNLHLVRDNQVEKLFFGKIPIERATAFYYYQSGNVFERIVRKIKYQGRKDLAVDMGKMMAMELAPSDFFEGIDMLVPIPLHPSRQRQRGYNQSERLAYGISAVTGIGVRNDVVVRIKHTDTQTHKSAQQRYENMQGVFSIGVSDLTLRGKHILLVDDVLTTSATLTACADALKHIEGIRFSVLTLALAVH